MLQLDHNLVSDIIFILLLLLCCLRVQISVTVCFIVAVFCFPAGFWSALIPTVRLTCTLKTIFIRMLKQAMSMPNLSGKVVPSSKDHLFFLTAKAN